ncbi:MAG: OadG family transporter subunit [Polaromonas sp.]|nr:OadG family transporter subunit [Polaromonas sp.]
MSGTLAQNLWAASELLVGFGIVMLTLALLWGLTALMAQVVAWFETRPVAPAPTPLPAPASASASATGPDDEEIAVVAAAVALMLDRPHRLVHVRVVPSAWGQQGRSDAHSSHRMT